MAGDDASGPLRRLLGPVAWRARWLLPALLLAGCGGDEQAPPLQRSGRLGSLRDLVLFDRAAPDGPFFLDRFEATRGDFAGFAASAAGRGVVVVEEPMADAAVLPMGGIDLAQARAFATWRCCRLPRSDEWNYACTGGGRHAYPWGPIFDAARANTGDLGVFAPLPVGTFESGRSGDGPYDLIGNVAEWSETVPGAWFLADREALPSMQRALRRTQRAPALAAFYVPGAVVAPGLLVAVAGGDAPREVLGADFATAIADPAQLRSPLDRSNTIGVRLCTTPAELLVALASARAEFGPDDLLQLERFGRRGNNAPVLRRALAELALDPAARAWLAARLP